MSGSSDGSCNVPTLHISFPPFFLRSKWLDSPRGDYDVQGHDNYSSIRNKTRACIKHFLQVCINLITYIRKGKNTPNVTNKYQGPYMFVRGKDESSCQLQEGSRWLLLLCSKTMAINPKNTLKGFSFIHSMIHSCSKAGKVFHSQTVFKIQFSALKGFYFSSEHHEKNLK